MPAWENLTFPWWCTGYLEVTQQEIWWVQSWFIFFTHITFSGLAQHFQEGSRVATYVGPSPVPRASFLCGRLVMSQFSGLCPLRQQGSCSSPALRHIARRRYELVYVGYVVWSCKSFCACHRCQKGRLGPISQQVPSPRVASLYLAPFEKVQFDLLLQYI